MSGPPEEAQAEVYEAVHHHIGGFFDGRDQEAFTWRVGPITRSLPEFHVVRLAPNKPRDVWVYFSVGAWEATASQRRGLEFLITAPADDAIHVETLAMVANYHADPSQRLGLHHTLAIGRPWVSGATCDCFLISRPYTFGPELELLELPDMHIHFLWLLPITARERGFAQDHGWEALEQRFEEEHLRYWDPLRASVVP